MHYYEKAPTQVEMYQKIWFTNGGMRIDMIDYDVCSIGRRMGTINRPSKCF